MAAIPEKMCNKLTGFPFKESGDTPDKNETSRILIAAIGKDTNKSECALCLNKFQLTKHIANHVVILNILNKLKFWLSLPSICK